MISAELDARLDQSCASTIYWRAERRTGVGAVGQIDHGPDQGAQSSPAQGTFRMAVSG